MTWTTPLGVFPSPLSGNIFCSYTVIFSKIEAFLNKIFTFHEAELSKKLMRKKRFHTSQDYSIVGALQCETRILYVSCHIQLIIILFP